MKRRDFLKGLPGAAAVVGVGLGTAGAAGTSGTRGARVSGLRPSGSRSAAGPGADTAGRAGDSLPDAVGVQLYTVRAAKADVVEGTLTALAAIGYAEVERAGLAGQDPRALFAAHPGRFTSLHVRDRTASGAMVDVGRGAIDYAAVFAGADRAGVEHLFVEHDQPRDPLDSVRVSFDAVRRLLESAR